MRRTVHASVDIAMSSRKPLQLSFTTGPMVKRWELLRTCTKCRRSFMIGFESHTCGIADHLARRRAATASGKCMERACPRTASNRHEYCSREHQRDSMLRFRQHLLSALHTSEALSPRRGSLAARLIRIACAIDVEDAT